MLILLPVFSYILGPLPMGLIYVRLFTGQDLRAVGSGRTGGTNAMRAAGLTVGLLTAFSDVFKGTLAVWLAQWLLPIETRAGHGAVRVGFHPRRAELDPAQSHY